MCVSIWICVYMMIGTVLVLHNVENDGFVRCCDVEWYRFMKGHRFWCAQDG